MIELNNGLEVSSMQGANRSKLLIETLDFEPEKFQTEEIIKAEFREMGASRQPSKLEGIGARQINTEYSVNTFVPPEIGIGNIVNSIV